jgi:dienelactone hydrolase
MTISSAGVWASRRTLVRAVGSPRSGERQRAFSLVGAGALAATCVALLATASSAGEPAPDYAALRAQVAALGEQTAAPAIHAAESFASDGAIKPVFFDGPAWKGNPTRVFAWLGVPAAKSSYEKIPGVVLVHGGGGTAFKEWVQKWNAHGFAAIAVALEGQTDERIPGAPAGAQWKRHALGGPARSAIYGDSAEPLADQWMFHAIANVVRAHSLLRAQPGVDAARIGICGISWGGVITSTVVGIDRRFAFGIPIYGGGALPQAAEHYGRALRDNAIYREVWEPLRWLPRATLPLLWFTGPRDAHFPLETQQLSYRAARGPRMVSVPFDMRHSHPAGWNPPDSYAFAQAVVAAGRPWAREIAQAWQGREGNAEFESDRPVTAATLVVRRGTEWEQVPATLAREADRVRVSATLPAGAEAWFFNLSAEGGLTLSSELQTATASPARTGATWDRVPLYLHLAKRTADLTEAEIDFLAGSGPRLITLEKSHGASVHGSTEAGIADTARRIKARNPAARVLFYLNAFINWPGYDAFKTYRPEWTLRNAAGETVTHPSGTPRPDPSNAEFREWWSEVVARAHREAPLDGVFADALPQALAPALARQVGDAKARAVVAGLREMLALTKRKLGPARTILVNGLRTSEFRELLDWEGIDGVMIEHFAAFKTDRPEDIRADLESVALAATKGKFAIVKGWPGFTWLDADMMKRPRAELARLARERLAFPLACFLVAAEPGAQFSYSWGYTHEHGMLENYGEFARALGPPQGPAVWRGLAATREFAHASVSVDLAAKTARIDWR